MSLLAKRAADDADIPQKRQFETDLCKFAADVFDTVDPGSMEASLFRRASQTWSPGCPKLAEHVSVALYRTKQATTLLPVLAATHDKLGGKLLRTLVAAGVLGGAGVGSLGFLLSRNARQSSAENEGTLEKARVYRQLANDIREDMRMNDVTAPAKKNQGRYDI